ncbi:MAG TPA: hypothetical protein VM577_14300 [Anaerovoracaceae bacterium]|nr:hypothetical protein [Anaerovoracaceae bacterium]
MLDLNDKRIRVIVGHYGSGKTEFSVNYALKLAEQGKKTALADLDIANPYFRSRERQQLLESKGIKVYSNTFGYDITADLPAITASIKAPLEDNTFQTIVDAGGDDSGARILIQFDKYLAGTDCDLFCVVNANRPETDSADGALGHIYRIEKETNLKITGLVNNTHLLMETKADDILKGYHLCRELSEKLSVPIKYNCCTEEIWDDLKAKTKGIQDFKVFLMRLYMRESWLDR